MYYLCTYVLTYVIQYLEIEFQISNNLVWAALVHALYYIQLFNYSTYFA